MRRQRMIATVAALLLLVPMAGAAHAQADTDQSCQPQAPDSNYDDLYDNTHRLNIDCLVWWDIDIFGDSGSYQPNTTLTRAQHAALLANLIDATDQAGAGSTSDQGFNDIQGHRYEAQINRLASLGVINGETPTRFNPSGRIFRDQMASLIMRLHREVFGESVQPGPGFEDTDGNVHEANIRRLVAAGITEGRGNNQYAPKGLVTRGQIASFTMRHTDLLIETGHAEPLNTFDPMTFTGTGDDVVDLSVPNRALAIAELTHQGDSNFIVWSFDQQDRNTNLLANGIGNYTGVGSVNFGDTSRGVAGLDVSADGSWTIEVRPAAQARRLSPSGDNGSGDDVVRAASLAGGTYQLTHDGSSNFIVESYDAHGHFLHVVANEIGTYQGTQRIRQGTKWLKIQADGNWTIQPDS